MDREDKRQNYIEVLVEYPGIYYDEIKDDTLEELEEIYGDLQVEFEEDECGLND